MDAQVRPFEPDEALEQKLKRLSDGHPPRVLDLFSGCGGISLGFKSAGFEITAAMDSDPFAARSHAMNFHNNSAAELEKHARPRDITQCNPKDLCDELSLGELTKAVDVIVGGPPCQAYARVGRAKLREVAEHPEAFRVDPRGNLYLRYLAYVQAFRPLALLMENVPDIMHYGGHNVVQEIVETLEDYGYEARYSLINTAFHGVPQMRDRVFLIGYRRELGIKPIFPKATNHMTLPLGYTGTRSVALRHVDLFGSTGYLHADFGSPSLPFAVTARDAIGDLPPIRGDSVKRGARRFGNETLVPYPKGTIPSEYAKILRQWPNFEGGDGVIDHAIRALPRDGRIFAAMPEGAEYPEAHRIAMRLFEEAAAKKKIDRRMAAWEQLKKEMVPPYDPMKFPNRWWKLRQNYPVRTLMAHIGKDTYSHIHWDPDQARTISVREAARLQSFPDGFRFFGTMNPAFRQIGNAVPPIMAKALATEIYDALTKTAQSKGQQVNTIVPHHRQA